MGRRDVLETHANLGSFPSISRMPFNFLMFVSSSRDTKILLHFFHKISKVQGLESSWCFWLMEIIHTIPNFILYYFSCIQHQCRGKGFPFHKTQIKIRAPSFGGSSSSKASSASTSMSLSGSSSTMSSSVFTPSSPSFSVGSSFSLDTFTCVSLACVSVPHELGVCADSESLSMSFSSSSVSFTSKKKHSGPIF